jgi:hypothetical protein
MENIVRLDATTILLLAERLTYADLHGRSVRICTGTDSTGPWVKWDAGSGWTPPYYGVDLYGRRVSSHVEATGCNLSREDFDTDDENCPDGGAPDEHPARIQPGTQRVTIIG